MAINERAFNWVTLNTADGRQVAGRYQLGKPVIASQSIGDLFDLVQQGDSKVALFALSAHGYVNAQEGMVSAWADQVTEAAVFDLLPLPGELVAFRTVDGKHYLSAPEGDEQALVLSDSADASSAHFRVTAFDVSQLPAGRSGCCHAWTKPEDSVEPLWNDVTHEQIVKWAIIGIHRPEIQTDDTRRMIAFWSRAEFQRAAYQGLDDADYKQPWSGDLIFHNPIEPRKSIYTWHDHFYSPLNGQNYMKRPTSAVTEGRRLFNLAVHGGMRLLKLGGLHAPVSVHQSAGHNLGLSLHFLTDLTQPMHAANFTNVYGKDGGYPNWPNLADRRHSKFEERAEEMVKANYLADYNVRFPLGPQDVATEDVVDASWFLHHTAVNQHRVFKDPLEKVIDAIGPWGTEWTEAQTKPTLDASLLHAPKAVARYMSYYARCTVNSWDSVDPTYYYRILCHGDSGWVCIHREHYKRDKFDDGRGLMFFIFNADGTWSIGCQAYKGNLWLGYDGLGAHWIGENRTSVTVPPHSSRFRFVPDRAPGLSNEFWIYENTLGHIVSVNEIGFPSQISYLLRWHAELPNLQKFRLQRMHKIPDAEQREIKNRWPDYLAHPWFGRD